MGKQHRLQTLWYIQTHILPTKCSAINPGGDVGPIGRQCRMPTYLKHDLYGSVLACSIFRRSVKGILQLLSRIIYWDWMTASAFMLPLLKFQNHIYTYFHIYVPIYVTEMEMANKCRWQVLVGFGFSWFLVAESTGSDLIAFMWCVYYHSLVIYSYPNPSKF